MIMPPEVIAASGPESALWSPSGKYALIKHTDMRIPPQIIKDLVNGKPPQGPPPGEIGLVLWDVQAHKATEVWKRPRANPWRPRPAKHSQ
jgi:hypothetical protein